MTKGKVVRVEIRMMEEEKEMAESIAKYLHLKGLLNNPSVSEAIRQCIRFTANQLLKQIEIERYGDGTFG